MTGFAEMVAATHYSFLRGASHPGDMVGQAIALGHKGIGIADRNTVAGVVRAWVALKDAQAKALEEVGAQVDFKLAVGARLAFVDGTPNIIAYPETRYGWGRLTRLLTVGNRRAKKGDCILQFEDLLDYAQDLLLIVMGGEKDEAILCRLAKATPGNVWLAATMPRGGKDRRHLATLAALAGRVGLPLLATNDALYAEPEQRPLHDILTCIREKTTIHEAGRRLAANAERHLKDGREMARLFKDQPQAVGEGLKLLSRVNFTLDQLKYEYPHEPVPDGWEPQEWLEHLTLNKGREKFGGEIPPKMQKLLDEEFALIRDKQYAYYFLTVHDIVAHARSLEPPILCQGRGSAANSAVCYLLGITSVDPAEHNLLFSRFVSEERNEPPDIDVDFEHERREEIMQYIYKRYGRHRAGIAATVIHYRPRSAVREVGKALGLSEDITARLSNTVWGSFSSGMQDARYREAGFNLDNPEIARFQNLVDQILQFPRHLSQHVGGFVLTEDRLDETVPIHKGAMKDRTFIEWDKDDIDALGLMKVDVLALGMLTCIRKAFDLIEENGGPRYDLDNIPHEQPDVYAMLQKGDSIGVFQVESRAQINMLPRLKPKELYDLVIQVAIVRPGPIQGNMVHPYLRRREGVETPEYPSPSPEHGPIDELHQLLGSTLGVPLFQEQAMKLAIVAAGFTPAEANQLRKSMATFRHVGGMDKFEEKMVGGMVARGYDRDFAERCYRQIEGFGSYGFPESHALSFARLVYVSSYIKCRYPAAFACALLNSQPMGFYAPAQIVRDAQEHGVEVRPIDVNDSSWDNELESSPVLLRKQEPSDAEDETELLRSQEHKKIRVTSALRLGFRQAEGFKEEWVKTIQAARPIKDIETLARDTGLPQRALQVLADMDAFRSLGKDRRQALWDVRRLPSGTLPLFDHARARELAEEADARLPAMPLSEHVAADYQTTRLSLKGHPMQFLRPLFAAEGVKSCLETTETDPDSFVSTAGIVLVRQRPGEGNAIFVTLEDETGIVNVVLWARLFETFRRDVMAARLMLVEGQVQRSKEGVVHLMASRIHDRSSELARLSDDHDLQPLVARADVVAHPHYPRNTGHPRDVRILPKSRDFH
jgi:error-prone DNA polymerase